MAVHLIELHPASLTPARAVVRALIILGYKDTPVADPTVTAAIEATKKLIANASANASA